MMMVQGTERVRVTAISVSVLDCLVEARIVSNARRVMASILKSSEPIKPLLPRPLLPAR